LKDQFPYLFWAYNLIWIFIVVYLGMLMAKQRRLGRQIDEIKSRLDAKKDA